MLELLLDRRQFAQQSIKLKFCDVILGSLRAAQCRVDRCRLFIWAKSKSRLGANHRSSTLSARRLGACRSLLVKPIGHSVVVCSRATNRTYVPANTIGSWKKPAAG